MRYQPNRVSVWTKQLLFVFLTLLLVGCRQEDQAPAANEQTADLSPRQELAQLDQRQQVPLLPMMVNHQKQMMRDHLLVIQEVMVALAVGDFEAVEASALRISYSGQNQQACTMMGAAAPGFTELGLTFHHTADSIVEAARAEDSAAVLTALGKTIAVCTSCHSQYRQELVSNDELQARMQALVATAPQGQ